MESLSKNDPKELETAFKDIEEIPKSQSLTKKDNALLDLAKAQKKEIEKENCMH